MNAKLVSVLIAGAAALGGAGLIGHAAIAQDGSVERFVYLEAEGRLPALESFASNPTGTQTQAIARRQNNCCGVNWSGRAQALFENFTPDARMTLRFEIPESATYDVSTVFTRAPDFGVYEFSIDGRRLGERQDGFAPAIERSQPTALGAVDLAEGSHTFTLTVVDKNALSSNYFAGLDLIELRTPGAGPDTPPEPTPSPTPTPQPGNDATGEPGRPGDPNGPRPSGGSGAPQATADRATPGLSVRLSPRADRRRPYRFTVSGRLGIPKAVRPADGCQGRVSVQVKAGKLTISNRRTGLTPACGFKQRIAFRDARRFARNKRLTVVVRFLGNRFVLPKRAQSRTVTVR